MNSADSGLLAANTETRNDSASMAVGAQSCHTLQEALVLRNCAFGDSQAVREVAACPPSLVPCPCALTGLPQPRGHSTAPGMNHKMLLLAELCVHQTPTLG